MSLRDWKKRLEKCWKGGTLAIGREEKGGFPILCGEDYMRRRRNSTSLLERNGTAKLGRGIPNPSSEEKFRPVVQEYRKGRQKEKRRRRIRKHRELMS